jgi:hypothetical protein
VTDLNPSAATDAFRIYVNRPAWGTAFMGRRGAIIKEGERVTKIVELTNYGDKSTGTIKKRELRFRSHEHRKGRLANFDEPTPKATWYCEGDEVERVLAFLQSDVARTGRYRIVDTDSAAGIVLDLLQENDSSSVELAKVWLQVGDRENLASLLSSSNHGSSIAQLAVIESRRKLLRQIQGLILDPRTTETQIQHLIGQSYWIFGGRYVGIADRRNLIPLDQHDIPLLSADGTLHIVELKGPAVSGLVRPHRNHWIVGPEVNEAAGQAMNYIRGIDELGRSISSYHQDELGNSYGMRRVFATVVIGHPEHVNSTGRTGTKPDEQAIQQTIRSYNSHLSRIEVRTYKDLVDAAERALIFENESTLSAAQASTSPYEGNEVQREPFPYEDDPWSEEPPF